MPTMFLLFIYYSIQEHEKAFPSPDHGELGKGLESRRKKAPGRGTNPTIATGAARGKAKRGVAAAGDLIWSC